MAAYASALAQALPAEVPVPANPPRLAARSLLRFITCGSVDDGKSTLLGRLLWETGSVFEDQAEALSQDSARFGTSGKAIDYALLVDGLSAEREQGITIDVAYRYFATPRRAFIAADTPGHEQYTRNMATGASTADVAILLVDARKGLLPQTRRHSGIVSLVGVRDVIVAVNKMDLVGYDEAVFRAIEADYRALAATLGFRAVHVLPLVARDGDNLTAPSQRMGWYSGPTLLHLIETLEPEAQGDGRFRLPVQWVNRPNADFRGFSGTVTGGRIRIGDPVTILPQGRTSRIADILTPQGHRPEAGGGEAITVTLADEIDISRGDVIVAGHHAALGITPITSHVLVLGERNLAAGDRLIIKLGTSTQAVRVEAVASRLRLDDFHAEAADRLGLNALGEVVLRPETPLVALPYRQDRQLGSFLLIDPLTHATLAMGVVRDIGTLAPAGEAYGARPQVQARLFRLLPKDRQEASRLALHAAFWLAAGTAVAGHIGYGLLLAALDLAGRPLLDAAHRQAWQALAERRAGKPADTISDGGGI